MLRVPGRHGGEQRREQVVGGHVLLVKQPGHPGQRGQAAGPLVQGRLPAPLRVAELHVPVHAAAERLVLRVAAPAQRVVLTGRARGPRHVRARRVGQADPAGHPVGAVLGHLDRGLPRCVPVGQVARLGAVEGQAQRPGRAVAHRPDDLVHPAAARSHEGLGGGAERGGQPVGAQAGVLADAPVVEDRDLLPGVGVALVGHPVRVLGVGEAVAGVRPVAERLGRRAAAPAQGQLGRQGQVLAQRRADGRDVGDQVGAVLRGHDGGRQGALELAELRDQAGPLPRGRLPDGQVLQGGDRLEQPGRGGLGWRRGSPAGWWR